MAAQLQPKDVAPLARALESNTSITGLGLNSNNIEEDTPMAQSEDVEMKPAEQIKEPETYKEVEEDAKDTTKPKIKDSIAFHTTDTTINILPSTVGNMLMSLTDGGFQYLHAGARANVGIKAGRYMFEVKIVEVVNPAEDHASRSRTPMPRQVLKLGFGTEKSSLFIGDTTESISFDSEGCLMHDKKRSQVGQKFSRDTIIAVVLNLDDASPNKKTLSLFLDGVRASSPQPLPECLHGKPLFPMITFKNVTLHCNFGPQPLSPLPFKCHMLQNIMKDEAVVKTLEKPKDGKYEVIYPVGLPDEGTFDRLDMWLEKNPNYTELSDRKILEWAEKSGVWRPKGYQSRASNDRPDMSFGITALDDLSVRRIINVVAPVQQRNFVVMEVKGNLCAEDRKEALARFNFPHFKKVAHIAIGEPPLEMKKRTHELMLKRKQEALTAEFQAKKAEEKRKKTIEKRQKELEKAKRKAEREKRRAEKELKKKAEEEKKKAEEAKRKAEEDAKKKLEEEQRAKEVAEKNNEEKAASEEKPDVEMGDKPSTGEPGEEEKEKEGKQETDDADKKQEEATPDENKEKVQEGQQDSKMNDEEKKAGDEDEAEEEEEEEEVEEEEDNEQPPQAELTAEEKKVWFRKPQIPDLTPYVMNTTFTKFSLPDKSEGFDDTKFEWAKIAKCTEYFEGWKKEKKNTTRIEELQPSDWFGEKWSDWQKQLQGWHAKQNEYKAKLAKKAADAAAKAAKKGTDDAGISAAKIAAKQENQEKEANEQAQKGDEEKEAEQPDETMEEKKEGTTEGKEEQAALNGEKEGAMQVDVDVEAEADLPAVDFEGLDVFGLQDVCNIGNGEPLFKEFQFEDWIMMSLRFELHLLAHAFRRDANDEERTGVHLDHLAFYYHRYYKKALSPKYYGVESFKELAAFVEDTIYVTSQQVIETTIPADLETLAVFVKLTEEARRDRNHRIDLGETSAQLKLSHPAQSTPPNPHHRGPKGGRGRGRGGSHWQGKGSSPYGGRGFRPDRQQQQQQQQQPLQSQSPLQVGQLPTSGGRPPHGGRPPFQVQQQSRPHQPRPFQPSTWGQKGR